MAGSGRFRVAQTCPNCKEPIIHECGSAPTPAHLHKWVRDDQRYVQACPCGATQVAQKGPGHDAPTPAEIEKDARAEGWNRYGRNPHSGDEEHLVCGPCPKCDYKVDHCPQANRPSTPIPAEPRFDNPRRCAYCGSKGEHLFHCDNPRLAAARPEADHD